MRNYSSVIEGIADIILTINKREIDWGLNQTLAQKMKFLIDFNKDFKDIYIGNYYCPEVIKFLLKEYQFIKTGVDIPQHNSSEKKSNKKPQVVEPEMFKKTRQNIKMFIDEYEV